MPSPLPATAVTVAKPFSSVVTESCDSCAVGLDSGAVKPTVAPMHGLPYWSTTRTTSGAASDDDTRPVWMPPETTRSDAGGPAKLARSATASWSSISSAASPGGVTVGSTMVALTWNGPDTVLAVAS